MTTNDESVDSTQLLKMMDGLSVIAELTVGYRAKLIAGGVGVDTADAMAQEFHTMLLDQAREGARQVGRRR